MIQFVKCLVLGLCFSTLSLTLHAQPKGFSNDPTKFIDELRAYFRDAKADNDTKKILETFEEIYNGPVFSQENYKVIVNTANKMADRKMKADQEYKDYLLTLIALSRSELVYERFDYFHKVFGNLLNKRNRDAAIFLDFASKFFAGNESGTILNSTKSVTWSLPDDNYELEFDTVPKVIVKVKTTLTCLARGNRSAVYETEGVYYPLKKIWQGRNGTVNWSRVGLDSTQVYAQFDNYRIDCNKSDFRVDSVRFYHKELFKSSLIGFFEDRLSTNTNPETAVYPKFDSYEKEYHIKNFFKNVDYAGGFAMSGNKLYGMGNDEQKASITIYAKDTIALKAYSSTFVLKKDEVLCYPAEISVYLQKDSIYHPGVEFRFNASKRKLILLRRDSGIGNAAFFDSYHQMSYEVERMEWNIDELYIEMGMIQGRFQHESFFESKNFYKEEKFRKVAGLQDYNPLSVLKRLSNQQDSKTISIASYAQAVRLSEKDVLGLLRNLVEQGFIGLNEEKKLIYIKEKTFNYISNEAGNLDYDVLRFSSLADSNVNARLDIKTKELEVLGIEKVFLSDSQSVYINPLDGRIKIKADRNMIFNGKVHAATLDFFGRGFMFDYNEFKITMPKIDSLKIKVLGKEDLNGRRALMELKTVLTDLTGELYIDQMNNKSGRKNYPEYPYFQATNESYVYYDHPTTQNGVYRREDFYFKIEPFKIDSLDNVTSASGLAFPGSMHSGGIFPDFKETLTFQPDTSLGFVTRTPEEGYPIYKGKGQYYNTIRLSNKGFYGDGKLDYRASTSSSPNFLFLLDSLNASINSFDLVRSDMHPTAIAKQAYMHWLPYSDSMFVSSKKDPIDLYEGKNKFQGKICYNLTGLNGNGLSKIQGADIRSMYFVFSPDVFEADTSAAKIWAMDPSKLALSAENVRSKIDFIAKKGDFVNNQKNTQINFPFNYYATTLPLFTWYFDEKYIAFSSPLDSPSTDYSFISTNPLQDSLNFNATDAIYDLQKKDLSIDGVPRILVADAEIIPDSNHVEIFGDAIMRRLENAVINANVETHYHRIYNAKVDIQGRLKYNSSGYYDYKTLKDTLGQQIYLAEIKVDSTQQTFAKGAIADSVNFMLNPKVGYKGEVYLHAAEEFLTYNGFIKINHNSQLIQPQYIRYRGNVNPDTVALVLNDPRDENKLRAFTGVHIGNLNYEGYATFLSKKIEPNDHDVIRLDGLMIYDEKTQLFKMGDKAKLFGNSLTGNYLTFNDTSETIYAEGKLDLGVDFGSKLTMATAGSVTSNMGKPEVTTDLVMSLDFEFLPEATNLMLKNIDISGFDASGTRDDRMVFAKGIAELFPEKEVTKVLDEIKLSGTYKLPKSMEKGFLFTDLQMVWDQQRRSWRSMGDKIGIAAVGNKQINKQFKGYVEVIKKRSGNVFNMYFELNSSEWYFFTFRQGQMEAISSDQTFNKLLMEKAKAKSPYSISAIKRKIDFVRSFQIN